MLLPVVGIPISVKMEASSPRTSSTNFPPSDNEAEEMVPVNSLRWATAGGGGTQLGRTSCSLILSRALRFLLGGSDMMEGMKFCKQALVLRDARSKI